jgi:drug/metabolite transporter (DMT)-like permease
MRTVDPVTIGVIRNVIIAIVAAAGLLAIEGPRAFRISRRELALATCTGIIGVVGFGILTFVGEHLAGTGSNAAKLTAVYAMALMVLWELAGLIQATSIPGLLELALVIAAYAGLALMISGGGISGLFSLQSLTAGALVLAGTACWMGYTVLFRRFTTWSVLKFSAITFLLGTAAFALIDALAIGAHVLPAPHIESILAGSPAYLYLGILAGAVPLILWNRSARVITPVNALMFMSVGTAVTVVIANHMSGYRENGPAMIVGGIAMIFAIGLYSAIQYRAGLRPARPRARAGKRQPVSEPTPLR